MVRADQSPSHMLDACHQDIPIFPPTSKPFYLRTDQLVNGFKQELDTRMADIKRSRVELERLYALRISDSSIDEEQHASVKEECMKAIRACEAAFTSYSGSVRSIKGVLETC